MKKYLLLIVTIFLLLSCWTFPEPKVHNVLWEVKNNSNYDIRYYAQYRGEYTHQDELIDSNNWGITNLLHYRTKDDERVISFDDINLVVDHFELYFKHRHVSWNAFNNTTGYFITPDSLKFGLDFFDENSWTLDKYKESDGYYTYTWSFIIEQSFVDSVLKYAPPPKDMVHFTIQNNTNEPLHYFAYLDGELLKDTTVDVNNQNNVISYYVEHEQLVYFNNINAAVDSVVINFGTKKIVYSNSTNAENALFFQQNAWKYNYWEGFWNNNFYFEHKWTFSVK